jgi:hypothetical protein
MLRLTDPLHSVPHLPPVQVVRKRLNKPLTLAEKVRPEEARLTAARSSVADVELTWRAREQGRVQCAHTHNSSSSFGAALQCVGSRTHTHTTLLAAAACARRSGS